MSCFRLSLMRARRRFSSSGFKLCGRTPRPRYGGAQAGPPVPRAPPQPQSPAPTLRSSAASPALRGSPMLDGEAAPMRAGCVRGARPPPRGAETRRCEGGPGRAPLRRAPVVSAPRPQPGFKKAVLPAPPRPAPQSQAACGSHLSALFLRGLELGGGRQSPRDLAPGLRVPSAVGSQARGTPTHTHARAPAGVCKGAIAALSRRAGGACVTPGLALLGLRSLLVQRLL